MSYCRVSERGSDVYVIGTFGTLECCGCNLWPWKQSFSCYTTQEMLLHLRAHRWAGEKVPESAIKRLEAEASETDRELYEELRKRCKAKARFVHIRKAYEKVEQVVFGKEIHRIKADKYEGKTPAEAQREQEDREDKALDGLEAAVQDGLKP